MVVTGDASLDGTLDIQTEAAFTPPVGGAPGVNGTAMQILTASNVSGTFSTLNGRHLGQDDGDPAPQKKKTGKRP